MYIWFELFSNLSEGSSSFTGQKWKVYRKNGGKRERIIPDLLIGTFATKQGDRLLTRDIGFYRVNFKDITIMEDWISKYIYLSFFQPCRNRGKRIPDEKSWIPHRYQIKKLTSILRHEISNDEFRIVSVEAKNVHYSLPAGRQGYSLFDIRYSIHIQEPGSLNLTRVMNTVTQYCII